jgi:hypothetical protein
MLTVESKLLRMCTNYGMSDIQAREVIDLAKPQLNELVDDYSITWNSSADGYPQVIYNTLFMVVKPIALKWINENTPHAWFKPMFE